MQTDLNKSEIANLLHISRRSLHYWVKQGNWERLKHASEHMPAILAENCYHIFAHLTEHLLSESRLAKPVTPQDAETLHKLIITINKLRGRGTLNENIEVLTRFMDKIREKDPKLAEDILPHMDGYLTYHASIYTRSVMPETFNGLGRLPHPPGPDYAEQQLDYKDYFDMENAEYEAQQALQRQKQAQSEEANTGQILNAG